MLHLRGLSDIYGFETNLRCLGMLVMAGVDRGQPFVMAGVDLDRVTPSQMPCTGTEIALC